VADGSGDGGDGDDEGGIGGGGIAGVIVGVLVVGAVVGVGVWWSGCCNRQQRKTVAASQSSNGELVKNQQGTFSSGNPAAGFAPISQQQPSGTAGSNAPAFV